MSGGFTTVKPRGAFDASQSIELMLQHADIFFPHKESHNSTSLARFKTREHHEGLNIVILLSLIFFKERNSIFVHFCQLELKAEIENKLKCSVRSRSSVFKGKKRKRLVILYKSLILDKYYQSAGSLVIG